MGLTDDFVAALQRTGDIAGNSYLRLLYDSVKAVEIASSSSATLRQYVKILLKLVSHENFALDSRATNEFAQILGEGHFYVLCMEKGITLKRVSKSQNRTPDFCCENDALKIFFEIKTLSVVQGDWGIKNTLEDALNARIEIEAQLKSGKRVASAISVVQPYGDKPYRSGTIFAVIDTLLEKARNNIKLEQYANPHTFLVMNLCLIPPFRTDNCVLCPAYSDIYTDGTNLTGDLWAIAFGRPDTVINEMPEFEGKPSEDKLLDKCGILADPDYNSIAGLLFIIHPLSKRPDIWGLLRSRDLKRWENENPDVMQTVFTLIGQNWNDDADTNKLNLCGPEE